VLSRVRGPAFGLTESEAWARHRRDLDDLFAQW
jgi:hypothetical protein